MPKRFSTKNLEVLKSPTETEPGIGVFELTDDYSIFHYGKMPDTIPDKGEAICRIAAENFKMLSAAGIPHHFRGITGPRSFEFDLYRLIEPTVRKIRTGERAYFIPLQVIFRNSLPQGNSVERRLAAGKITLEELGLKRLPKCGEKLESPIIEFTTKLEEIDRFLTPSEAQEVSGLTDAQFAELKALVLKINKLLVKKAESLGLELADAKGEFAVDRDGRVVVADHVGTPDEMRLLYKGVHVGKQVLRNYYLPSGIEAQVQNWVAKGIPRSTWPVQHHVPREMIDATSVIYHSLCELWTGERVWNAPTLDQAIAQIQSIKPAEVA
jgi:phosphoribosylaminoimidazole-succinocarboxamide synthase